MAVFIFHARDIQHNLVIGEGKAMSKLQIEKDAKNRAYAFIIAAGLFHKFAEFCEMTRDLNPHDLCIKMLALEAEQ